MELQKVKWTVSAAWVLVVFVVGLVAGVKSSGGLVALTALGLLPPLALLLMWNEPPQTMSESIRQGRR
jgi:hypothetical protein